MCLGWITPGVLQAFDQLPKSTIQRSGNSDPFAAFHDRSVHEIDLGLPLRENVLQHAGFVFAGGVRAFFHEGSGIAVQLDAQRFGDRFSFFDQSVEERTRWREASCCTMMQQGESADRIRRSVEDELGPLRAAGVLQRNDAQTRAIEQVRELLDSGIRSFGWLERADPGVPVDVEASVSWLDDVAGGKGSAANHERDVLRDNFFVADTILHGANSARSSEKMRRLLNCRPRVCALSGDNSKIARGNFLGNRRGMQARDEIGGAADAQASLVDRASVFFPDIVGMHFHIGKAREVSTENAADGAAADNADFDTHAGLRASKPV